MDNVTSKNNIMKIKDSMKKAGMEGKTLYDFLGVSTKASCEQIVDEAEKKRKYIEESGNTSSTDGPATQLCVLCRDKIFVNEMEKERYDNYLRITRYGKINEAIDGEAKRAKQENVKFDYVGNTALDRAIDEYKLSASELEKYIADYCEYMGYIDAGKENKISKSSPNKNTNSNTINMVQNKEDNTIPVPDVEDAYVAVDSGPEAYINFTWPEGIEHAVILYKKCNNDSDKGKISLNDTDINKIECVKRENENSAEVLLDNLPVDSYNATIYAYRESNGKCIYSNGTVKCFYNNASWEMKFLAECKKEKSGGKKKVLSVKMYMENSQGGSRLLGETKTMPPFAIVSNKIKHPRNKYDGKIIYKQSYSTNFKVAEESKEHKCKTEEYNFTVYLDKPIRSETWLGIFLLNNQDEKGLSEQGVFYLFRQTKVV